MAELSVQIGANIQELQNKLPKALKLLDKLKLQQKDLTKAFENGEISADKYYKRLAANSTRVKKITNTTNRLKSSLSGADKGINKLGKSTSVNATPALQEFSRVVQDAPFGIMGVGNNIQQLTANFGNLSKSAGGSKAALKAMVGSLAGPGGVLLAVSAVTTLLTVYGDDLLNAASSTNELAEATKDYLGEAKAEISTLEALVSVASSENSSKTERAGAIKEINDKYSKYLGNLDEELIKTDNVRKSIDNLTKSLIVQAKIKGLQDLITEKSKEASEDVAAADFKQVEAKKKLVSEINKVIAKNSFLSTTLGNVKNEDERIKKFIQLANKYKDVRSASTSAISALSEYNSAVKDNKEANNELDSSLEQLINTQTKLKKQKFGLDADVGNVDDGAVIITAKPSDSDKPIKSFAQRKKELFAKIDEDIHADSLKAEEAHIDNIIKKWEGVDVKIDPFSGEGSLINSEFQKIIDAEKRLQQQTQIMGDAVGSTFGALSNQITNSLQTGNAVMDAFVGSIIGSLTNMLAEMAATALAEKAIATSKIATNQAVATSAAVSAGAQSGAATGPAGFFTTPGFIAALVGVVGAAFAGIGSFAKGGFSGDDNLAFLNKNELVLRPFEQAALFNVLKGTGISGVSNNQGGSSDYGLDAQVVLRGQNQVVQLRRAEKRMKRNFNS